MTQINSSRRTWVIMPVFNEAASISSVVEEWLEALRKQLPEFVLCLLDDGSTDRTAEILAQLATKHTELMVINKANSGHGQSCLFGYRLAIDNGAECILQIDSDGQCDPRWLPCFLEQYDDEYCLFGTRKIRRDGWERKLVSVVLRWVIKGCTGISVKDANVPYRLMPSRLVASSLGAVPADVDLANIFLSMELQRNGLIKWVPIDFRQRRAGRSSTNFIALGRKALELIPQLRRFTHSPNTLAT